MIFLRFLFNFTFPTHWKTVFILLAHKLTIFPFVSSSHGDWSLLWILSACLPNSTHKKKIPHIGLLLVNCCVSALIVYQSRSNQETITKYWSHVIRSFLVVLNQQHPLCRNTKHCDLFLSIDVKRKYLLCMHWVGSFTYK